MAEELRHFFVERESGGHTRQIALDAKNEDDAKRQVASLFAHEKKAPVTMIVAPAERPKPRASGYGHCGCSNPR